MRTHGFDNGVIVAQTGYWAGNLRLHFPDSLIVVLGRMPVDIQKEIAGKTILAIWDAGKGVQMPDQIRRFLDMTIQATGEWEPVIYREFPFYYSTERVARTGFLIRRR